MEGKKTYTVVIAGLLVIAGQFLGGEVAVSEAVNQALILLGIAGVRHGVATES